MTPLESSPATVADDARAIEELAGLRAVFDASPIAILARTLDGTITHWNAAAERLYGYAADEVIGRSVEMLFPEPWQVVELAEANPHIVRGEVIDPAEGVRRRRDGSLVEVEVTVSPVHDADGQVVGACVLSAAVADRPAGPRLRTPAAGLLEEAQAIARLGSWEIDQATGRATWTDQVYALFGVAPERARHGDSSPFRALVHPDDLPDYEGMLERVLRTGEADELEFRVLRPDGQLRIFHTRARRVPSGEGVKLVGTVQDVTEARALERETAATRDLFAGVLDAATELSIIGTDAHGQITVFNRGAELMLGYTAAEVVGRETPAIVHDPTEVAARAAELGIAPGFEVFVTAARRGRAETRDWTYVRKNGSRLTVSLTVTAVRDSAAEAIGFIGVARDVSEARAASAARREAERRFKAAFEHAPIGVAITGLQGETRGTFLQTNAALNQLVGAEPGELDGTTVDAITHPDDRGVTEEAFRALAGGESVTFEKRYIHRAGHELAMLISVTPVPAEDGKAPLYAVAQCLDVSESKAFEEQLRELAEHDPLTGLLNRQRFESELARVIAETRRYDRSAALLMLDLDGFKQVNDQFGHPVGDELVVRIGGVLAQSVRATDVVARLGGDEFAVILNEVTEAEAVALAEKIVQAVRLRGVVTHGLHHARVSASVGVTTFDAAVEYSREELIVEADNAMYSAKAAGRDGYVLFRRGAERRMLLTRHDSWLERLSDALQHDHFVLHAQPIAGIGAGAEPWFELLLRLPGEGNELIPLAAFLGNAERLDLMGEIDRWVLRRGVALLHERHQAGQALRLAVNLSAASVGDAALVADLAGMLAAAPIPPGSLVLELDEGAAIGQLERAAQLGRELRALGCRIALDDFGSGFASFSYLEHLTFDYLKIEGEFVTHMRTRRSAAAVVRAVADLAGALGAQTVAKCVGDEATVEMLRGFGVQFGQGFHLGMPGPLEQTLPPPPAVVA